MNPRLLAASLLVIAAATCTGCTSTIEVDSRGLVATTPQMSLESKVGKLPQGYPSGAVPLYPGSKFTSGYSLTSRKWLVLSRHSYTVSASTTDSPKAVVEWYANLLRDGWDGESRQDKAVLPYIDSWTLETRNKRYRVSMIVSRPSAKPTTDIGITVIER